MGALPAEEVCVCVCAVGSFVGVKEFLQIRRAADDSPGAGRGQGNEVVEVCGRTVVSSGSASCWDAHRSG